MTPLSFSKYVSLREQQADRFDPFFQHLDRLRTQIKEYGRGPNYIRYEPLRRFVDDVLDMLGSFVWTELRKQGDADEALAMLRKYQDQVRRRWEEHENEVARHPQHAEEWQDSKILNKVDDIIRGVFDMAARAITGERADDEE